MQPSSVWRVQFINYRLILQTDEDNDPHFEPVIKLTEQVDTKTGEEEDDVIFKMCVLPLRSQYARPIDRTH